MAKKVALLIGVSEYGEGIPSLSAPLNDVAAMKRVLENSNMGGFDEVETLSNPDPTVMRLKIQQIFASCDKNDLVLLFFSGHGITDDNYRLYLTTKGTSKDFYKATSVPASFIHDVSLDSYAKRQAIILDCCYSGAFAEGWQTKSVGLDLQRELGGEGRVVLTSSTATQTSFQQEEEKLSLYTKYLVEGIETGAADQDEDGKIYAHELHDYAKGKVQEEKPNQKPDILSDREGYKILISQVNDPESVFRTLVKQCVTDDGQITIAGNSILHIQQKELGITKDRAEDIVDEVLAPYRERHKKIKTYIRIFREEVEQDYPLPEKRVQVLQALQNSLGLEDRDIEEAKQQIIKDKEAEQEEYAIRLQQYEQEFSKAVEQEYPLGLNAQDKINSLQQSLKISTEDIKRIEQSIVVNKKEIEEQESSSRFSENSFILSLLEIARILSVFVIAAALALVLIFSFLDKTPQFGLNNNISIKGFSVSSSNFLTVKDFYNMAKDKIDREDYQGAIEDLTKAIKLQPHYSLVYNALGYVYASLKDYQEAFKNYDKAIQINKHWGDFGLWASYNNRGIAHLTLKDYQKAIADFTKAVKIKPDFAFAYYERGYAYYYLKNYQAAIADCTRALELNPDFAIAYKTRGAVYLAQGDYQKAIADYDKALELNPDLADAYYSRGLINKRSQGFFNWKPVNRKAAIQDFTKASELYKKQENNKGYQNALNRISELQQ